MVQLASAVVLYIESSQTLSIQSLEGHNPGDEDKAFNLALNMTYTHIGQVL